MLKELNYNFNERYKWEGFSTDRRMHWIAYFDNATELINLLDADDVISLNEINEYIENNIIVKDAKALRKKIEEAENIDTEAGLLEKLNDMVAMTLSNMSDDEVLEMLEHLDSSAYYQRVTDMYNLELEELTIEEVVERAKRIYIDKNIYLCVYDTGLEEKIIVDMNITSNDISISNFLMKKKISRTSVLELNDVYIEVDIDINE